MITKLRPELKSHIEEYIEEIEQNRVYHSIINCPLDILNDYISVLKLIDVTPMMALKTYIDIATFIDSNITGRACCTNVILHSLEDVTYEFSIPVQPLNWLKIQEGLSRCAPYNFIQSELVYTAGTKLLLQVSVHPIGTFKL